MRKNQNITDWLTGERFNSKENTRRNVIFLTPILVHILRTILKTLHIERRVGRDHYVKSPIQPAHFNSEPFKAFEEILFHKEIYHQNSEYIWTIRIMGLQ